MGSHENNGNHGGGVFTSGRKRALYPKMASQQLPRREKTESGLEKWLANPWSRKKIMKHHPRWLWARNHMGNPDLMKLTHNFPGFALIILLVTAISVRAQDLTAFVRSTFSTSAAAYPYSVIPVDINSVGKPDLVEVNFGDQGGGNTLTVFTNNGNGAFGSNATLTVGFSPTCVIAADVNGDGKPDLICANFGYDSVSGNITGNTLTVLTNNGAGKFGLKSTLTVGGGPYTVLAADINQDGWPDLICSYTNGLTLLTNSGNGNFGSNATIYLGYATTSIVAVDVNGDGKIDLVTANPTSNTLTVLTNNGKGVFSFKSSLVVGAGPRCVVAADINGDGKPDLISANYGTTPGIYGNTLTVLTNNGKGDFGSNATLTVGSAPWCVVAADINDDGKPDLISTDNSIGSLTVLTNNGTGAFGFYTRLSVGSGSAHPVSIAPIDVNGDGLLDLVIANYTESLQTVLTQVIVVPPALNITPNRANQFNVSWSSFYNGFAIQTNGDLTTTNWLTCSNSISVTGVGGTNFFTTFTTLPPTNLFFRLMAN